MFYPFHWTLTCFCRCFWTLRACRLEQPPHQSCMICVWYRTTCWRPFLSLDISLDASRSAWRTMRGTSKRDSQMNLKSYRETQIMHKHNPVVCAYIMWKNNVWNSLLQSQIGTLYLSNEGCCNPYIHYHHNQGSDWAPEDLTIINITCHSICRCYYGHKHWQLAS